jgi:sucrose-6-phosphate hydrolase SacC (GH32 family)
MNRAGVCIAVFSLAMLGAAVQAENKPAAPGPKSKTFKCDKQFLLIPSGPGGQTSMKLEVDGKEVRFVTGPWVKSAKDVGHYWFFDISEYKGKEATLSVGSMPQDTFDLMITADKVPGSEKWGSEKGRPQFHCSQRVGWINDPNGMVYHDGEWHLYYQHNPVKSGWGNMTWGHAVSRDLCTWEYLPNAIHHTSKGAIYSGGAVVDYKNTGGWKTGKEDVIVAAYTYTARRNNGGGECIAYSNDRGRTFKIYEGNPVITDSRRDPKPIWYKYDKDDTPLNEKAKELGGHWVIGVYSEGSEGKGISYHTSVDLKNWTKQSYIDGYFECPEIFELAVDGNKQNKKWVMFGGSARYAVGDFDGKKFTPEHEGRYQIHYGAYYASQCFSGAPDGRVIQMGWVRGRMGGTTCNGTFSYPTELTLRSTKNGIRMFGNPVKEIEKIHARKHEAKNEVLNDEKSVELKTQGDCFDISATFDLGSAKVVKLFIDGHEEFAFDCETKMISDKLYQSVKRKDFISQTFEENTPLTIDDNKLSVRILVDRSIKELFLDQGERILTKLSGNDLNIESVKAVAEGGEAKLISLEAIELNASWKR